MASLGAWQTAVAAEEQPLQRALTHPRGEAINAEAKTPNSFQEAQSSVRKLENSKSAPQMCSRLPWKPPGPGPSVPETKTPRPLGQHTPSEASPGGARPPLLKLPAAPGRSWLGLGGHLGFCPPDSGTVAQRLAKKGGGCQKGRTTLCSNSPPATGPRAGRTDVQDTIASRNWETTTDQAPNPKLCQDHGFKHRGGSERGVVTPRASVSTSQSSLGREQ